MNYYYDYKEFILDTKRLIRDIDYEFDTIIAIARGGLTLSHILGEHYNIRKVYTINTIGYDDNQKLNNMQIFNIPNLKNSKNILIVDDIVDSGDTLKLVLDTLYKKYPNCTFKSASIFSKTTASTQPDWYIKEAKEWIDFFWTIDTL